MSQALCLISEHLELLLQGLALPPGTLQPLLEVFQGVRLLGALGEEPLLTDYAYNIYIYMIICVCLNYI